MPSPTLTTLAELKAHLGISTTSEDVRLNQFLVGTEEAVKRSCRREFVSSQATEYYDGHDRSQLVLNRRPLTAVASVHVHSGGYAGHGDNAFAADTEWTLGTHFYPDRLDESENNGAILIAIRGIWPAGRGNIKVVNTAGYTTIPEELKLGVHMLTAVVRDAAKTGAIKGSETIGRYAYSLLSGSADGGIDAVTARSILEHYREVSL